MYRKKFFLAFIGYILVTFVIAAGWHLVLFKGLYDQLAIFTRKEPLFHLGLISMVLQGLVLAYLYPRFSTGKRPLVDGVKFGLLMGVFMGSNAVFAEAGKQEVSSLSTWIVLYGNGAVMKIIKGVLEEELKKPFRCARSTRRPLTPCLAGFS